MARAKNIWLQVSMEFSKEEATFLAAMRVTEVGTRSYANLIRRALESLALEHGMVVPDGVFQERRFGAQAHADMARRTAQGRFC